MDRYIGIDVHMHSSTLAVVGPSGKRLQSQVLETNGSSLIGTIRSIPRPRHLCFEEGTQSAWLYEILKPEVDELVVAIAEKRPNDSKSDERDAWDLAEKLRVNGLKRRVFKGQGAFGPLRDTVRAHRMVTQDLVRVKNRLMAVYRSRGLHEMGDEAYRPKERERWLRQLPPSHRQMAEMLGRECDVLQTLKQEAEERMLAEAKKHPITATLATAPAIGPIRAAQIVAAVMTPHRFRTKRQFWNYCGLAVVTSVTAQWKRGTNGDFLRAKEAMTRGLNRNRNGLLKHVFKGAAHHVAWCMPNHPLHQDYQRMLKERVKPNLAQLTLARRLAASVLSMWKHEEVYDPAKHRAHKA
jgi:transposase